MTRRRNPLRLLTAVFAGELPREDEWPGVLETANRGWLAPALYLALDRSGNLASAPEDVRAYLAMLHDRNRERNVRLRAQLIEAAAALNARGINPVLLKGAIGLLANPSETLGSRMISDLDIAVQPSELADTRAALAGIGYEDTDRSNEMARAQDAGTVELHEKPNGRSVRYLAHDVRDSSHLVQIDGASVWIPSPTARALHLVVHDLIKDGDYWRLGTNLRHLRDMAELAASPEGINWDALRAALNNKVGLRALELRATALHGLFGVETPADLRTGRAKLRHKASLLAARRGMASSLTRAAGRLSWGLHRFASGYRWAGPADFGSRIGRILTERRRGSVL